MPIVRIEVTPPGITLEQKKRLIEGVTDLLVSVLDKDSRITHILITDVEGHSWGFAGRFAGEQFNRENHD